MKSRSLWFSEVSSSWDWSLWNYWGIESLTREAWKFRWASVLSKLCWSFKSLVTLSWSFRSSTSCLIDSCSCIRFSLVSVEFMIFTTLFFWEENFRLNLYSCNETCFLCFKSKIVLMFLSLICSSCFCLSSFYSSSDVLTTRFNLVLSLYSFMSISRIKVLVAWLVVFF